MKNSYFGFIYITTCKINGKRYLGKRKYSKGWETYLGSGVAFNRAVKKYGKENFSREIILECSTEEELNYSEELLLKEYNCVGNREKWYNISPTSNGGNTIEGFTEAEYEAFRKKLSGENNGMYGKGYLLKGRKHSEVHRLKNSEAQKKYCESLSAEQKALIQKIRKEQWERFKKENPIRFEELKRKISEANKGKVVSEETKKKMSAWQKGVPKSKETVEKLRKTLSDGRLCGDKNPMFGNGHRLQGSKNGRATAVVIIFKDGKQQKFETQKEAREFLNIGKDLFRAIMKKDEPYYFSKNTNKEKIEKNKHIEGIMIKPFQTA